MPRVALYHYQPILFVGDPPGNRTPTKSFGDFYTAIIRAGHYLYCRIVLLLSLVLSAYAVPGYRCAIVGQFCGGQGRNRTYSSSGRRFTVSRSSPTLPLTRCCLKGSPPTLFHVLAVEALSSVSVTFHYVWWVVYESHIRSC